MPNSAMVPSTQMRTSTIGPTAMRARTGWRSVTQKKTARTARATATVALIASVCRSVMASVTVTAMMVSGGRRQGFVVAKPESFKVSPERLRECGIARIHWELNQHRINA